MKLCGIIHSDCALAGFWENRFFLEAGRGQMDRFLNSIPSLLDRKIEGGFLKISENIDQKKIADFEQLSSGKRKVWKLQGLIWWKTDLTQWDMRSWWKKKNHVPQKFDKKSSKIPSNLTTKRKKNIRKTLSTNCLKKERALQNLAKSLAQFQRKNSRGKVFTRCS